MNARSIHPKVIGAGSGAAVGVLITAILDAAGVKIPPDIAAAASALLAPIAGYLTPAKTVQLVIPPQLGSEEASPIL